MLCWGQHFYSRKKQNNNNKKKTSKKKPLWFKIHKNCLQSIYNLLLFILPRKNLMFQNRYLSAARCIKRKRTGHLHSNHGYHGLIQIITCFLCTAISTGQLRENYLLKFCVLKYLSALNLHKVHCSCFPIGHDLWFLCKGVLSYFGSSSYSVCLLCPLNDCVLHWSSDFPSWIIQ